MSAELIRAAIAHVPRDPWRGGRLELFEDGGLLIRDGRVADVGEWSEVRRRAGRTGGGVGAGEGAPRDPGGARGPTTRGSGEARVVTRDERGAWILPGLVDGHVHLPQVPVLGALGMRLLEWLERRALPEEARWADAEHARAGARAFLRLLAAHGTTSAMVFGAHFAPAMDAFFEEAERSGLRISAGLVLGDRLLRDDLHTTPERAYRESAALAARWHGRGRLRYAVTPRFALSCGDALLAACGRLLDERPELAFTTHLSENPEEVATVARLFPDARDYLDAYDRHGLVGRSGVFAHVVHPEPRELARLAEAGATSCHCPCSNFSLGSGLFPLRRHVEASVRVCLGSDVGGGPGFSVLQQALAAYQGQMLLGAEGEPLDAARLLWLATRAGAEALGLDDVGDLAPGRAADLVVLRPPSGSALEAAVAGAPSGTEALTALISLARAESVVETRVAGEPVHRRAPGTPPSRSGARAGS